MSAPLSDLEAVKLCAQAMRIRCVMGRTKLVIDADSGPVYWPLTDDGQCFALVKRFGVDCLKDKDQWLVGIKTPCLHSACDSDLNLAVVHCVAKLQLARTAGG